VARKLLTTPKGVRDIMPEEASWRRELEARINQTFIGFGYREVVTPTIEYLEVFTKGSELDEKMYKFVDREGEILALRADMTTPVARLTCSRMKGKSLPVRLCYFGNLFRYDEPQAGRKREFYQAGVEMIGDPSPEADAEVVALAYYGLKEAGIKDFRIDLGHVGYVEGLLEASGLDEESKTEIKKCLIRKNLVGLEQIIQKSQEELGADLDPFLQLLTLRGGIEILDKAGSLANNPISQEALKNLAEIMTVLKWYGIEETLTIDLSMVKEMDYYTGLIMEGYSKEMGYNLLSGGRYNKLLARFGQDLPATGFALGLDRALLVLERQNCVNSLGRPCFRFYSPEGWNGPRIRWITKRRKEGLRLEALNNKAPNPEELLNTFVFIADDRVLWRGDEGEKEFDLEEAVLFMTVRSIEQM